MQPGLALSFELARDQVRIGIAGQERRLEENKASRPDTGGTAEPGKDLLGDQGLHQKQQERGQENGGGEQWHGGWVADERRDYSDAFRSLVSSPTGKRR